MANERLRHIGGWLLTVALEVGAALMALQAAWLIVVILFFAGVGTLAVAQLARPVQKNNNQGVC
jgi:hypothetical protein